MNVLTVKMSRTKTGSPGGTSVREYEKDKTYDLPESLAKVFISLEVAEEVIEEVTDEEAVEEETPKKTTEKTKPSNKK